MSLKEFEINDEVSDGLIWGGITLPHVMQQKDGSCFSVIEYEPYEKDYLSRKLGLPKFRRGWAIWNERQHNSDGDRDFLVIFWNPFETKLKLNIENTLGEEVAKKDFLEYFGTTIEKICTEFSKVTQAKLLKYQELMNFLSFTLTLEKNEVTMPEVPLYMDSLLSQDIKFEFKANDIFINGKKILIVSLPDFPRVWEIFERLKNFSYRYVRRILLFDEKESAIEMKKYCEKWCPHRKIMLDEIEREILSELNGYCWNGFIFSLDAIEYEKFQANVMKYFQTQEFSFIFEHYNLKDVWWGSLPGVYLANITPPLVGFDSMEKFILHREPKKADRQEHKFKKFLEEMDQGNVSNGQV